MLVGVTVGVLVGVLVGVDVGVLVGVFVGVDVDVLVAVAVGVFVGVLVGVDVGVFVGVFVGVTVGVFVAVLVGVGDDSTTTDVAVKALLLPSFDSGQIFSGSTVTWLPRLVNVPVDVGVISNVRVAVAGGNPPLDVRQPPV